MSGSDIGSLASARPRAPIPLSARAILTPPPIATEAFTDGAAAVARLDEIYQRNTQFLRDRF